MWRASRLTSPQSGLRLRRKRTNQSINRMMKRLSFSFLKEREREKKERASLSLSREREEERQEEGEKREKSKHYHFSCSFSHVHAIANANASVSSMESITCSDDSSRMISTTVTVRSAEHNLRSTRCRLSHTGHRPLKERLRQYQ